MLKYKEFINESKNKFLDSLSLDNIKEISSYLEIWMQSDNKNFDMSKIDRLFELLKGSKYIITKGEIFRLLYFDTDLIVDNNGKLDENKIKSIVKVDDKYYSYTKSLPDIMYLYWMWTEYGKGDKEGLVIKQKLKNGLDLTTFNSDLYEHLMLNYKNEKSLISNFLTFMTVEDQGEKEIISKKDSDYEIEGIIYTISNQGKSYIVKSYDDFEEEGLFFYKTKDFKLKNN